MKSYYEKIRDDAELLEIGRDTEGTYPAHFHRDLEIMLTKRGSYEILINGRSQKAEGSAVFVMDSFDVHRYVTRVPDESGRLENKIIIIPYTYARGFNEIKRGRAVSEPVIKNEALVDRLYILAEDYIATAESEAVKRSAAELFLAMLSEHICFSEGKPRGEIELVRQILSYIHDNFKGEISRADIARALGYTETHISRVFHSYLLVGIPEYVGKLRLDYVEAARKGGDKRSLTALIFEAGFNSQQTYYRCKKSFGENGK